VIFSRFEFLLDRRGCFRGVERNSFSPATNATLESTTEIIVEFFTFRCDAEHTTHRLDGLDYVGPLPAEIQKITVFSAGVTSDAKEPAAAKALIQYLSSPEAYATIKKTGLEPAAVNR
jgi:hypothetical protein